MTIIPMPGAIRGVTHVKLDRVEFTDSGVIAEFFAGVVEDGVFVNDADMQQPMRRSIADDQLADFRAWALAEEGAEDSPTYGVLVNARTVMRWVGWHEYHDRLDEAEWDALLPTLMVVLDTNPPPF